MPGEVLQERLQLILEHASVIEERVQKITTDNSFLESKEGVLLVDSLITRLQALAENVKKIQKSDPVFFRDQLPLDVHPIIRFRDLVSHHYEMLDQAMVLQICKLHVPPFAAVVQTYLKSWE